MNAWKSFLGLRWSVLVAAGLIWNNGKERKKCWSQKLSKISEMGLASSCLSCHQILSFFFLLLWPRDTQGVYSGKKLAVQLEPYQVNLCPLGVGSQNSIWLLGQGSYRGAANCDGAVNVCFGNGRGNSNVLEEAEGTDLVCAGLSVVREGVLV